MNQVELYDQVDDRPVDKWEYEQFEDALGKMEALRNAFQGSEYNSLKLVYRRVPGGAA